MSGEDYYLKYVFKVLQKKVRTALLELKSSANETRAQYFPVQRKYIKDMFQQTSRPIQVKGKRVTHSSWTTKMRKQWNEKIMENLLEDGHIVELGKRTAKPDRSVKLAVISKLINEQLIILESISNAKFERGVSQ